ncbi:MAG: hypothetical protein ACQESG_07575 [Nanobdellota archaeon]
MISRKKIRPSRYLAAFSLTIVIFLVGFIVGSFINEMKFQKVYDLQYDIRIESLSNELLHELVSNDLCENINMTSYNTEMYELGKRITYMEEVYGYDSEKVQPMKNYYSLLLIRQLVLNKKADQECNLSTPNVLYFYTNRDCEDCSDQGLVLTSVHKKYPFFNTFAFEYHLENHALDFLKKKYEIDPNRLPTLVIDDETYYGFQSREFLIDKLDLPEKLAQEKKEHPAWYD